MTKTGGSLLKCLGVLLLVSIAVGHVQAQTFAPPPGTKKYAFFPQGGNFFGDLYPNNFVDVKSGAGVGDWHCTDYTIDGHRGIDSDILGFTAQEIGVPIFAVLDGTVLDAHDGEFDMHTGSGGGTANFVLLGHGNGHKTWYWHMKKGSVAVSEGQQVKAGQQIGLTGSSGLSSAPHLHFESDVNGVVFEPFAGSCRPGTSNWTSQPAFRPELYLREFVMTQQDLNNWQGPPFDTTRTGTFNTGTQAANMWFVIGNGQGITKLGVRFLRPDGSEKFSAPNISTSGGRDASYKLSFSVNFDITGTWKVELSVNQQVILNAPIQVVSPGTPVTNSPPTPVTAVMDPASDGTLFCRITSSPILADADYDFVSYHYVWKVNGTVVRDIVSAGMADAIQRDASKPGDLVTCTITPTDGKSSGSSTVVPLATGQLLNIATRVRVQSGDKVLIGGFIIAGNDPKKVIVRGIGPSLSGVPGVLADPTLELHQGDTTLAVNDDWKTKPDGSSQQAEIEATNIAPTNDAESAIVMTLNPGSYTASLSGKNGGAGIGVVEVYDLDQAANSRLANISTRGFVDMDDNAMIAGLIAGGGQNGAGAQVLIRALGPSLSGSGIQGPLQDPTLELHDANGTTIATNDNWKVNDQTQQSQEDLIQSSALAPSNDLESAILATLSPGPKTAIVRGKNNSTGVGLVEVYNLQ
jgi:hypothetical protein